MIAFLQRMAGKPGHGPRRTVSLQLEVLADRNLPSSLAFGGTLAAAQFVPPQSNAGMTQAMVSVQRSGEELPELASVPVQVQADSVALLFSQRSGEQMPALM